MSGAHCPRFPECMKVSDQPRLPSCDKPNCPGNAGFLPMKASQRLENLKAAFAENDILAPSVDSGVSERDPLDGNRSIPMDRETLGQLVREAWVRWAKTQPNPKPSWLVPYSELSEPDKEADRQIGEAIARWTIVHDATAFAMLDKMSAPALPVADARNEGEREAFVKFLNTTNDLNDKLSDAIGETTSIISGYPAKSPPAEGKTK